MLPSLSRPLFACLLLLCAGMALMRARPLNSAPLYDLIDSDDCAGDAAPVASSDAPCWLGIRVGETRRAEALALLDLHPWVGQVFETSSIISWRWSGAQPSVINEQEYGLIGMLGDVVQRIRIQTRLPYGEVWLALGVPDGALLVRPVSRSAAFQILDYDAAHLRIVGDLACPVTPAILWESSIVFALGDVWQTEGINGAAFNIYGQSGWWRALRRCRPQNGS